MITKITKNQIKEIKKMRKEEKRQYVKEHFENPFKVGDIVHHSWGYDQTQCDYYQVINIKKASVLLKPIATETVKGSEAFMSRSAIPIKDKFIESHSALTRYAGSIREIRKRVSAYVKDNGDLRYYIPTPYGWCDLWDGSPQYHSWYA